MKKLVLGVLCLVLLSTTAKSQVQDDDPVQKEQAKIADEAQHFLDEAKAYHAQALLFARFSKEEMDPLTSYCWALYSQIQDKISKMYTKEVDVCLRVLNEVELLNAKFPSKTTSK